MTLITLLTKALHFLPSEVSHHIALISLKILYLSGILKYFIKYQLQPFDPSNILNIKELDNKLGIAAGLDKNGDYIDCLAALGIGFIEVGTVTPKAQPGNARPRIFRNRKDRSLLNRLGFNNKGVDYLVKRLKLRKSRLVVGTSIGKNFDTPNEKAFEDYIICLNKVYEFSDYIAVNISSPNTKDLRQLSSEEYFSFLLRELKSKQSELSLSYGYKPIFIKLSPDEDLEQLSKICKSILDNKFDGIIFSNTTNKHHMKHGIGGLSGAPLKKKADEKLSFIRKEVGNNLPIIASGGVMTVQDFQDKIDAGADLVQLYTGFIYEGPKLIQDIININSLN